MLVHLNQLLKQAYLSNDLVVDTIKLRKKYGFSFLDSLIVQSAISMGCDVLFTEDMQHELVVENKLKIINPFL
jgi:predicted nucleic acid-binding protein